MGFFLTVKTMLSESSSPFLSQFGKYEIYRLTTKTKEHFVRHGYNVHSIGHHIFVPVVGQIVDAARKGNDVPHR
jgi:hypothetical protein